MKKVVLITGGSGFLGHNLAAHLLARGYAVRSLDLVPFDYPHIHPVESLRGDVRDPDVAARACAGVTHVVHCAAKLPRDPDDEVRSVTIDGTRAVLAGARAAGCERFVFTSSTAVYGLPTMVPLREDAPLDPRGAYAEAKVHAEELCRHSGAPPVVSVLRPKSFLGRGRLGVFGILFDWVSGGHHIPLIGTGLNRFQLLDVEDLCEAIRCCLEGDAARVADTFNVGAERFGTVREDLTALLAHAGFGKRVVPLPGGPVLAAMRLLERAKLSPLYGWVYETAAKDSYVAVEKLKGATGWGAKKSNSASLIESYDDYVRNVGSLPSEHGTGHRQPWRQGALALAKRCF